MLIAWALFGALMGFGAAHHKGFSVVAGVLGGILLGPLSVLMFFVSGVAPGDQKRKCPHCAEFIKAEASICKHCHQPVPDWRESGVRQSVVERSGGAVRPKR